MAKLTYITNVSLDGFIEDAHGSFDWTHPVLVGGGQPALPREVRAELQLVDERRFTNGIVYLRYRIPL